MKNHLTIYLETQNTPQQSGCYDLIWCVKDFVHEPQEIRGTYKADNRVEAALANLGKAARDLYDEGARFGLLILKADVDGEIIGYKYDDKYAHHTVYDLVVGSGDPYRDNKAIALFYEYGAWIGKIKRLVGMTQSIVRLEYF